MTIQIISDISSNHYSINPLRCNHPSQIINDRRHWLSCYYSPISKSNYLYLSLFQCWISKQYINPAILMCGWIGLLIGSPSKSNIAKRLFKGNISERTLMNVCRVIVCECWCCCLYILACDSTKSITRNNIYKWIFARLLGIEIYSESISWSCIDEHISIVYSQSEGLART